MLNTPSQSNKKILIVEDEDEIRSLYVGLLTGQGYHIFEAKNGQDAYDLLVKGGYDLVLLDIMLPQMDGFEIIKKLQENKNPQQPINTIVLLTNLSQDQTVAKGTELGVKGYMIKSDYNPQQFLDQVNEFLST